MFFAIARASAVILPWLGVMAVSVIVAYALTRTATAVNMPYIVTPSSTSSNVDEVVGRQACVNNAWVVYIGANTWLPDARVPCPTPAASPGDS